MLNNPSNRYAESPMLVYWELTRSCALACKHCRAEAIKTRHPLELTFEEAKTCIDQLTAFPQKPHIVLTGGDPLNFPDLEKIIHYINESGLTTSLAPSATHNLNIEFLQRIKDAGVKVVSLSIDGHDKKSHDGFRQVEGCFEDTMKAARMLQDLEIPVQINTLLSGETFGSLQSIYELLHQWPNVIRWSIFFLIETGRGAKLHSISPAEAEAVMEWVYECAGKAPFDIKTTEAPHYRRVAWQKSSVGEDDGQSEMPESVKRGWGIRDGNGIMFMSHIGDVHPSGFLPVKAGNIREQSPVEIYQNSKVFKEIRDPDLYKGKCGYCQFRYLCGGSRARAYGWTGDYLASDPLCKYKPTVNVK